MVEQGEQIKNKSQAKNQLKSSYDLYLQWINWYQRCSKHWGADIFRDDYKINIMIIIAFLLKFAYFFHGIYFSYFLFEVDREEFLKSVCFVGTSVQGMAKIWTVYAKREDIRSCHNTITELTMSSKGQAEKSLKKFTSFYLIFGRLLVALYLVTVFLFFIYPVIQYQYGRKEAVVNFFIPFVDNNTNIGYFCNIMAQLLQTINSAAIFAIFDNIFFYYLFFAASFAEFVEDDCKVLTEEILRSERKLERNNVQAQRNCQQLLLNVIKRNQKMDEYFEKIKFFQKGLLLHAGCIYYSLMITTFMVKVTNYYGIYLFAGCYLTQLTLFSVVGTYIESKYDKLPMVIYDVPWYHLSVADQKTLAFVLQHSQQVKKLYIMGESSFNVETGLAMIKSIYSVIVMLDSMY